MAAITIPTNYSLKNDDNKIIIKKQTYILKNNSKGQIINSKIFKINEIINNEIINIPNNLLILNGNYSYNLYWTELHIKKFGTFPNFDIYQKAQTNIYEKQTIPIRMNTQINLQNELFPISFEFILSNIETIILIK